MSAIESVVELYLNQDPSFWSHLLSLSDEEQRLFWQKQQQGLERDPEVEMTHILSEQEAIASRFHQLEEKKLTLLERLEPTDKDT